MWEAEHLIVMVILEHSNVLESLQGDGGPRRKGRDNTDVNCGCGMCDLGWPHICVYPKVIRVHLRYNRVAFLIDGMMIEGLL